MADNNLARTRNDIPNIFADDDPLAELARIVGYDERLVPTPQVPVPAGLSAPRREPAFNLEDELLREFEQYDAPRLEPANDAPAHDHVVSDADRQQVEFVAPAAPVSDLSVPHLSGEQTNAVDSHPAHESEFDGGNYAIASEPVAPEVREETWSGQPQRDPEYPFEHVPAPIGSPEPVAAVVTEDLVPVGAPASFDPFAEQTEPDAWEVRSAAKVSAPLWSRQDPVAHAPEEPVAVEAAHAFDLADELETSIAPEPAPAVAAKPEVKRSTGYVPGFRMPLANFHINSTSGSAVNPAVSRASDVALEPFMAPIEDVQPVPAAVEALAWDFVPPKPTGASEPWSAEAAGLNLRADQGGVSATVAPEPVAPVEAMPVASVVAQAVDKPVEEARFSPLDDLVSDAGRFPITQPPIPVAAVSPVVPVSSPAALRVPAEEVAPVVNPVVSKVEPAPIQQPPAAENEPADLAFDPFNDEEFELALDDLELDLADVVVAENTRLAAEPVKAAPPVVSQPAPVPASVATAAVPPAASSVSPSVTRAAEPVVQEADESLEPESDLPFDPSLIAESEERPEAIAELDVPALPVEEPEHEPAYRPEYDIDIDAELATLLVAATPDAAPEPARPVAASAGEAKAQDARPVYADLDEFERALEEDFRRSLATPLPPSEGYPDAGGYRDESSEGQGRASRNWVLPLAVVGALAVVGGGAYAWLGNGVSGIVSGDPVIIAADKDPIKVAPENPGGKTVPNQDKAVYDRVAGASPESPKQQTLISSDEQPVDVVQKTLMPDNLPLEGEDEVEPTDVGQTEDPRLLPQQEQQAAAASQQDPVTVTPRKVKTMIVRPDGKLVEQEVSAPAPALAAPSQKMPAASTKSVEVAALPAQGELPATSAPNAASGIVPVSAPAESAKPVPAMAPVTDEPAVVSQPAPRAPVPAMRPAQQPVNVVAAVTDQGNVRPAQAPAAAPAAAGTQVGSLGDGGYVIQIASLPTQADAQKSYQNLSAKFGSVIGGRGVDIKAAEIAGKGTFYRVRIPAGSKAEAVSLCERYRSAGGTCLVAK